MKDATVNDEILPQLRAGTPLVWLNTAARAVPEDSPEVSQQIGEALDRLHRAESLIRTLFDLGESGFSPLYSPLLPIENMPATSAKHWMIKADHALPVAGSIKARGGFHEVIAYAERLALSAGLITAGEDLLALSTPAARALFAEHAIVVGSTGNLGMSIGLCGTALGFKTVVHMSVDAREWKKQRLRDHGAVVVEHAGDYGEAVAKGRALAELDAKAHFVDDEKSVDLFSGYACAAWEIQHQLSEAGIKVDEQHPLVVYLPCGVGGAPGGITYGLKQLFGGNVYCFFIEPTQSPCMLVQLLSGVDHPLSVYDIGLTNRTALDGLAVGAASLFVAPLMQQRLTGIMTIADNTAYELLRTLHDTCGIKVEPSAATALYGPSQLEHIKTAFPFSLTEVTHISWSTGGLLVPESEYQKYLKH